MGEKPHCYILQHFMKLKQLNHGYQKMIKKKSGKKNNSVSNSGPENAPSSQLLPESDPVSFGVEKAGF